MNLWFVARATGLTAFLAFTVAVTLGALASARSPRRPTPRSIDRRILLQMWHRSAAVTGLLLVATHVTSIVIDSYVDVSPAAALIPLISPYKMVPVSIGVLALWTAAVVALAGAMRGRLAAHPAAPRVWRTVHAAAYLGWATMLLHALLGGTDRTAGWALAVYLTASTAVVCALGVRLVAELSTRRASRSLVRR